MNALCCGVVCKASPTSASSNKRQFRLAFKSTIGVDCFSEAYEFVLIPVRVQNGFVFGAVYGNIELKEIIFTPVMGILSSQKGVLSHVPAS